MIVFGCKKRQNEISTVKSDEVSDIRSARTISCSDKNLKVNVRNQGNQSWETTVEYRSTPLSATSVPSGKPVVLFKGKTVLLSRESRTATVYTVATPLPNQQGILELSQTGEKTKGKYLLKLDGEKSFRTLNCLIYKNLENGMDDSSESDLRDSRYIECNDKNLVVSITKQPNNTWTGVVKFYKNGRSATSLPVKPVVLFKGKLVIKKAEFARFTMYSIGTPLPDHQNLLSVYQYSEDKIEAKYIPVIDGESQQRDNLICEHNPSN